METIGTMYSFRVYGIAFVISAISIIVGLVLGYDPGMSAAVGFILGLAVGMVWFFKTVFKSEDFNQPDG